MFHKFMGVFHNGEAFTFVISAVLGADPSMHDIITHIESKGFDFSGKVKRFNIGGKITQSEFNLLTEGKAVTLSNFIAWIGSAGELNII
ncbi:MAG: hypothetical protein BWY74_01843 [Firmicutes bacterium ADurb.Bin419]|nr:MAG: hypothetical protein BWY74_01843 [Firmicutes bacterium ADurb.Bin419]